MSAIYGKSTIVSGTVFEGEVRLRPARKPLFGRRRLAMPLTPAGWFSVLCVVAVAIGAALAVAI
jgi:hypothetical protein